MFRQYMALPTWTAKQTAEQGLSVFNGTVNRGYGWGCDTPCGGNWLYSYGLYRTNGYGSMTRGSPDGSSPTFYDENCE